MIRLSAAILLCMASAIACAAPLQGDPLNMPAPSTALAARSVLTTITRTGARLVAGGERGLIVHSADRGKTWQQASVPVRVTITSIRFADEKTGWAVGNGGAILRTNDGGATWEKQFDGNALVEALDGDVQGLRADRRQRLVSEGADKPFLDIYVKDADNAIAVGAYGLIFATSDGGRHWLPAFGRIGTAEERHFYAIRKIGSRLYLAGEQGAVYRSADDGSTFQPVDVGGKATYFSIVGAQDDIVLLGLRGTAYRSTNGGATWNKVALPTRSSVTDARASNDGSGYLLVDDGGSMWQLPRHGDTVKRIPASPVFPFSGVEILPDNAIVIVGALGFGRAAVAN